MWPKCCLIPVLLVYCLACPSSLRRSSGMKKCACVADDDNDDDDDHHHHHHHHHRHRHHDWLKTPPLPFLELPLLLLSPAVLANIPDL